MISRGKKPDGQRFIPVDLAIYIKEKFGIGQDGYDEFRQIMAPNVVFPPRYRLDEYYKKKLRPPIKPFKNDDTNIGVWLDLNPALSYTLESALEAIDYKPYKPYNQYKKLTASVLLGIDGK